MGPIIDPRPDIPGTESWKAWTTCSHVKNEKVDMSESTNTDEPTPDRCKSGELEQKGTLDQTACGDLVFSGDQDGLKGEITADKEQSHGDENSKKEETSRTEKQTSTANAALSSDNDLKTEGITMAKNTDEQDPSADEVTSLSTEDCVSSEPHSVCHSSNKDSEKGDSFDAVENKVTTCPECQKMRRQKEKPFLNKKISCGRFVWNKFLLQGFEGAVHPDWILHIVHGFVGQSSIRKYFINFILSSNQTDDYAKEL